MEKKAIQVSQLPLINLKNKGQVGETLLTRILYFSVRVANRLHVILVESDVGFQGQPRQTSL